MNPNSSSCFAPAAFVAAALLVVTALPGVAAEPTARIELGRHLVEDIAQCADCHAPRQADGQFDKKRWFQGAPLGFAPTVAMPWAPVAPGIAGLPAFTDEHILRLLTTGERPDGTRPLPPMPSYRLGADEAAAVIAYLRSLAPAS